MKEKNEYEILIGGRGGQGILLTGYLLGKAFIEEGYYVVNSETYSAETRGGFSRSDLIIIKGEEEPDLIRISKADIAIFMYPEQMKAYSSLVSDNATVFIDSTFISKPYKPWSEVYLYPFTDVAREKLDTSRVANIVALGYFVAKTGLLSLETVEKIIKDNVKESWVAINLKAVKLGYDEGKKE